MFNKILIANRGEIACRVIKTANKMGINTVAVYSEADKNSVHVEMADESYFIGPPPATESYLAIAKIIEVCKQSGAEAVHPGYGFLSENSEFCDRLTQEGIIFIGPNSKAIEVMGDKIESKKFANKAKVSTVPGNIGVIKDAKEAVKIAGEIGFPVMIKASAGGGGKGMRIAWSAEETTDGFERARSEAASSFGDDRIFIEKFIENPRHIEIQVLADKHGNVIHLNERECSIQRRNQKVIEEAPSPLLDKKTRQLMGEQAVSLAKAVGYDSAGTVEFVVGQDKSFYFLEMNTRLQVEHPVTELITDIDLVEQMIRVAAGEKLKLKQNNISINGWAVESRIYAEDPYRNFLPSIGRLVRYQPPKEVTKDGITVRNDTGVTEGSEISMFYDPMVAKLVTHAKNRKQAIEAMSSALDGFLIDGIQHNIPFLTSLMKHNRWQEGKLSTGFIAEEYPDGFKSTEPNSEEQKILAAVALSMEIVNRNRLDNLPGRLRPHSGKIKPNWVIKIGSNSHLVKFISGDPKPPVNMKFEFEDGSNFAVSTEWQPGDLFWRGTVDQKNVIVQIRPTQNGYKLNWQGISIEVFVFVPRIAELDTLMPEKQVQDTSKFLLCPMPGLVVSINVSEGQEVKTGEILAVIEAMKMENVLRAERDAVISSIKSNVGESLAVDSVIMEFE